ncbi:four-carbon acid sugar kinase family protein [Mycolicibacterium goodii]|uniref:four-carbon acid sugar kinase family protein n=1 Tax=Mycolicibacterium goodii TaxID=134601 RepID=UPI0006730AFE
MITPIHVLADDLSGAAEVAGGFLGRESDLVLRLGGGPNSTGVTVVDLNTRTMTEADAVRTVGEALDGVAAGTRVVKKIDSLLRGHIRAEVAVLAERGPVTVAVALPALQRRTAGGVLYLGDTPLHETGAWHAEPTGPPRSVAELFDGLAGVEVCDAATDADLDEIVRTRGPGVQFVGTAALTAAIARTLPAAATPRIPRRSARAVLAVVGTAAPVVQKQISALDPAGLATVVIDSRALLHDKAEPEPVHRALERGTAVVTIGGTVEPAEASAVSRALAAFVAAVQARTVPDLVLTGGETARAVVDAIGISSLRPVHQIHHGAVVSVAPDGRRVVTRPGSFGDTDSLSAIVRYLNQRNEDDS